MSGTPSSDDNFERMDILAFYCCVVLARGNNRIFEMFLQMPQAAFAKLNFNSGSYENNEAYDGTILLQACKLARKKMNVYYIKDRAILSNFTLYGLSFYLVDDELRYTLKLRDREYSGKVKDVFPSHRALESSFRQETNSSTIPQGIVNADEIVNALHALFAITDYHKVTNRSHCAALLEKILGLPEECIHRLCLDITTIPESHNMKERTREKIFSELLATTGEIDASPESFAVFYLKLSLEQLNFLEEIIFTQNEETGKKLIKKEFSDYGPWVQGLHQFTLALKRFLSNVKDSTVAKGKIPSELEALKLLVDNIKAGRLIHEDRQCEMIRNICFVALANYLSDVDDSFEDSYDNLLERVSRGSPQLYSLVALNIANKKYEKSKEGEEKSIDVETRVLNLQQALLYAIKAFTYDMSAENKHLIKYIAYAYLTTTKENVGKTGNPSERSMKDLIGWMDPLFEINTQHDETKLSALILPQLNAQKAQADLKKILAENQRLRQELQRNEESHKETNSEDTSTSLSSGFFGAK